VILLDANLLIYAHVESFRQHVAARTWLDAQLGAGGRVALPWPSLLAFLRIVTNPRVFERPEPMSDAWRQIGEWLDVDSVWIPQPTERHGDLLVALLQTGGTRANLVPDAHLAALSIEHGLIICSTDSDFARFRGVRWENPLRGTS
jgi:toxin-antitoxin system PIN domain toxin